MNKNMTFILAVACLAILPHLATEIYVPSLPAMVLDLHSSSDVIQLTLTSYLLSLIAGQLCFGPISDRYGRNTIILVGIGIAIIATLGCIYAHTAAELIGWRGVQGIGFGALAASSRAILPDNFSGAELAKRAAMISTIAPIFIGVTPVIGGYLQLHFGWQSNFVFILIYAILLIPILHYRISNTAQQRHTKISIKGIRKNYWRLLTSKPFMAYSLCTFSGFIGLTAYFSSATFLLQDIVGLNAAEFGNLALIIGVVSLIAGVIASKTVTTFGINKMIFISGLLMFGAAIAIMIPAAYGYLNIWVIVIPAAFYTAGVAIITPVAGAAAFNLFRGIAGSASALSGSLRMLGAALGSLIIAVVAEDSQMPLAIVYLGSSILVLLLLLYIVKCETIRA